MQGFENIVVGMDEGDLADGAIVTALHLSRLMKIPLHVVHAMRTPSHRPWFTPEKAEQWFRAEDREAARRDRANHIFEVLKAFATTPEEIDAMLYVASGRPANVLTTFVADRRHSLMVLGGHRHRGLLDFGGTTREVLSQPLCPMWVQDARSWSELQRILVAVDLSPGSAVVLAHARDLARAADASITVLHCFEPPVAQYDGIARLVTATDELRERERREFQAFLERNRADDPPAEVKFEEGDPAAAVLGHQKEHQLVVMGTHGHSALHRVLVGSHAYQILNQVEVPVVVVPQPVL